MKNNKFRKSHPGSGTEIDSHTNQVNYFLFFPTDKYYKNEPNFLDFLFQFEFQIQVVEFF